MMVKYEMDVFESEIPIESYEGDFPEASSRNTTMEKDGLAQLKNIAMDSNFAWLLCSLLSAGVIYITYYHIQEFWALYSLE